MSYKYVGLTMTHNESKLDHITFSKECLGEIVENQSKRPLPVTFNFTDTAIGVTVGFDFNAAGNGLLCTFESDLKNLDALGLFVVPGGDVHINDMVHDREIDTTIINKFHLTSVALTARPADLALSAIKNVDNQ